MNRWNQRLTLSLVATVVQVGVVLASSTALADGERDIKQEARDMTKIRAVKYGNTVYVRSAFGPKRDLIRWIGLGGTNHQISFHNVLLAPRSESMEKDDLRKGVSLHRCGDDACPWNLNGTYIGGNHGCSDAREVTSPGHGLTEVDIGTEWRSADGTRFYPLKIVDENRFWILSEDKGKGAIWKFVKTIDGNVLESADGKRKLPVKELKMVQLTPASRFTRQEWLIDGKTSLKEGEPVVCSFLDGVEDYDIINPASVVDFVRTHPGKKVDFANADLEGVVNNKIVYRFLPRGACVIDYRAKALQKFKLGYMGFIQTARLTQGEYDALDYYIPKTSPFEQDGIKFDFRHLQDYREKPPTLNFRLKSGLVEFADNPPERFIQLLGEEVDGKTVYDFGYVAGYSLIHGLGKPEKRRANTNNALFMYKSSKTYPMAVNSKMGPEIPAGTEFHCVAYRQYFNPRLQNGPTCFYWHRQNGDMVAYVDYHQSVRDGVIQFPKEWAGRGVEIIEKTPSFTLEDSKIGLDGSMSVDVNDGYGYGVLKIDVPE